MRRRCSDEHSGFFSRQSGNTIESDCRKWGNSYESRIRVMSNFSRRFKTVLAVTAVAAIYTLANVDGFSTSTPRDCRIRRSVDTKASTSNQRKRLSFQYGGPGLSFGPRWSSFATASTQRLLSSRSDNSSDQTEWKAVVRALQLYKAAYGDLKVPMTFVVPSMAPWPESAWGMALGKKVGAIRESGLYLDKNEKRRDQLESLGFVWRIRAPRNSAVDSASFTVSFDQIYDALVVYRSEIKPSGPLSVPVEFTVPDAEPWPEKTRGLPLGRSLEALRSKDYLAKYPGAKEKLEEIGFETDSKLTANDKRFQAVYLALERYKEIYGDALVPQPFVVPSNSADWPEESWGLRLGARVNAIRSQGTFIKNNEERRDMLDAIGFVWTPPEKELKRKLGRKSLSEIDAEERRALIEASNKAGGPSTSPETDEDDVESFLSSFDFSSDDDDSSDSTDAARTWGLEADSEVKEIFPTSTMDPYGQDQAETYVAPQTLGESLAAARKRALESGIIEDIDSKRAVKRKRDADIPWFNDDFGGDFVFEDVVEALTLYKQFYGDFSNLTNAEFVIPVTEEPELSFDDDLDFGNEFSIKGSNNADITRFDEFDDPMMSDGPFDAESLRVEQDASTPENQKATEIATLAPAVSNDWPEHLEGMRLGDIVRRIKDGSLEVKHLPERKTQLDALEFDWGNPLHFIDVPFEKAMCAMYAYYLVRGDMFVPPDFVMPDEDPWPQALSGYELGTVVKRIRELQNFFEAFHTEKVGLLRMVDFVWFPTLALPIDPNEEEMSAEMLMAGGLGHPDYYFLEEWQELPFGLADKIISEGPFNDVSDDPRMWWREWHNWDYVEDLWYSVGTRDRAVQLRRGGFPQLADEHEAKYGPGLFHEIDEFLSNVVLDFGKEGFERLLGVDGAKQLNKVLELLQMIKNEWPFCTTERKQLELMLQWDSIAGLKDKGFHNATLNGLFRRLDGSAFRGSQISDPFLEETKTSLYSYLDELRDCIDIPTWELEYVWQNRIKTLLIVVQAEIFDIELGKDTKPESTRRKGKNVEEEEMEDIYEEHDDEEYVEEEEYADDEEYEDETKDDSGIEGTWSEDEQDGEDEII